jgi:hypothetical protein
MIHAVWSRVRADRASVAINATEILILMGRVRTSCALVERMPVIGAPEATVVRRGPLHVLSAMQASTQRRARHVHVCFATQACTTANVRSRAATRVQLGSTNRCGDKPAVERARE